MQLAHGAPGASRDRLACPPTASATASPTASPTFWAALARSLLDLLAAGVEAALGGVAGGAGDPAAGLAEQFFLALAARQQGGEQRADREAADHRADRIDGELVGRLAA